MKRIIKSIILLLIVMQIFCTSSSSYAKGAEIGDNFTLIVLNKIEGITMSYYGQEIIPYFTVYEKNGEQYPVYCVDYFRGGVTDTRTYEVQVTEEYVDENYTNDDLNKIGVWKAIINGYPFKTYTELGCIDDLEAYAATKQAVFCMLYDRDLSLYHYEGDAGKRVYNAMEKIVTIARNSGKVPMSTKINLSETEWQLDEINNKFLSKKITLNCDTMISSFNVSLTGDVPEGTITTDLNNNKLSNFMNCNEFKVLVPLDKLVNTDQFIINVEGKVKSYPMYFGKAPTSNLQSYVLTAGITKQEYEGRTIEYPENKTKLIINKYDKEGNVLEGVKFNILDKNKNVLYENLVTDKDGVIKINNIIPGMYYIQEIETIDGYEFNDELIEINITLDETKEIIIENEKIPEEPEIPEEPDTPEKPETPEEPEIPEVPEIPEEPEPPEVTETPKEPDIPIIPDIPKETPPEIPKLPRTGY